MAMQFGGKGSRDQDHYRHRRSHPVQESVRLNPYNPSHAFPPPPSSSTASSSSASSTPFGLATHFPAAGINHLLPPYTSNATTYQGYASGAPYLSTVDGTDGKFSVANYFFMEHSLSNHQLSGIISGNMSQHQTVAGQATNGVNPSEVAQFVTQLLQQVQDRFQQMSDQILSRIDEMDNRIDELEQSLGELMQHSGIQASNDSLNQLNQSSGDGSG